MNKIVQINAGRPEPEIIRRACVLLEAGELVVVPTETVYGIACAPEHLEKLYAAKERDRGKPIARLAASLEQVKALGAKFGKDGLRLAEKYWPGPLTLVLETPEGMTGFRVPNHEVPLAFARAFGRPIALTSANKSGGSDAVTAQEAFERLEDRVALFLDAGECTGKPPSTVVFCTKDHFKILREGAISPDELNGAGRMKKLIFVCTGNTCRSPMAEGLMRKMLGANSGWEISSAGICAADGAPVSRNAAAVLQEKGIDISAHRARHLSSEMIEEADLLIAMTQGHCNAIRTIAPEIDGKVFLLKSFGVAQCAADIADPVGADLAVYRRVRDEIDAALPDLVLFLMEERNDT
jgi:tRNA threonylcarbamoyl adenosine modification protein (Sua5/YciO/YrdC/YwlC family)